MDIVGLNHKNLYQSFESHSFNKSSSGLIVPGNSGDHDDFNGWVKELERTERNQKEKQVFQNSIRLLSLYGLLKSIKSIVKNFLTRFRSRAVTRLRGESTILSCVNALDSGLDRHEKRAGERIKEAISGPKKHLKNLQSELLARNLLDSECAVRNNTHLVMNSD